MIHIKKFMKFSPEPAFNCLLAIISQITLIQTQKDKFFLSAFGNSPLNRANILSFFGLNPYLSHSFLTPLSFVIFWNVVNFFCLGFLIAVQNFTAFFPSQMVQRSFAGYLKLFIGS